MKISKRQAKTYLLHYHYLHGKNLAGKQGALTYFDRVQSIQFDPLNMVGTNPELVLQARIHDFKPAFLHQLLYSDRKLIDGWDKNMCIYKVGDWPYFARYRTRAREYYHERVHHVINEVKTTIAARGPIDSRALALDEVVIGDWGFDTNVARLALESLYLSGETIVYTRNGSRKTYDLIENHMSAALLVQDDPFKNDEYEFYKWQVYRRIQSVGLMAEPMNDALLGIRGLRAAVRKKVYAELLETGLICEVEVTGINYRLFYLPQFRSLFESKIELKMIWLGPLDNMIWDRKMIEDLFGFYYRWEVYKPATTRVYGYYVLPVLYGAEFIARIEAKFDKSSKTLHILNWWFEDSQYAKDTKIKQAFDKCLNQFMQYLGAEQVIYAITIF